MTATEAEKTLKNALEKIYEQREAANIADWVVESITGMKRWKRKVEGVCLSTPQVNQFKEYQRLLADHMPIQYVLGESWFCGLRFFVNEHVLIPRPETEELVKLIVDEQDSKSSFSILDIGTGSGCIPIALKKQLPSARITSIDVSGEAINIAKKNADTHKVAIQFDCLNFLDAKNWNAMGTYDIIVSNPPYIPIDEKDTLSKNVTDFEPGVALFVPGNDALLFYKAIAAFAKEHLAENGKIYMEVHEKFSEAVASGFNMDSWGARVTKDLYGKQRFVTVRAN